MAKSFDAISEELSFLINTAIASSNIKSLKIEEKKGIYDMRPVMHIILSADVGQVKSTVLQQIAKEVGKEVVTDVTRAGLVGTIDSKTMQIIPGCAWDCRGSLLLLDEFTFGKKKKEGWEVFLQLLESQRWGKRFALFTADQTEEDGDLYYKVSKGRIDLKTRFAAVVATMKKFEHQRGQDFKAFCTRTVPYFFDLNEESLEKIAHGTKLFIYNPPKVEENIVIKRLQYNKIVSEVKKCLKQCNFETVRKELFLRSVGDACRACAVWGKIDKKTIHKIVTWKIKAQERVGAYYRKEKHGRER